MTTRDDILGNIRTRLGRTADDRAEVDAHLQGHPSGPLPARTQGTPDELRERFIAMARKASADVEELDGPDALPGVVARICGEHGFEPAAVAAPDPALEPLDWRGAGVASAHRAAEPDDRVGIGHALCAVAETGTLVLASGPQAPVTPSFLPDVHVVALEAARLVGGYEEAWARVRAAGAMPRTVNWITGPSRSADIEQTIQLGAHGPVRLVIALS